MLGFITLQDDRERGEGDRKRPRPITQRGRGGAGETPAKKPAPSDSDDLNRSRASGIIGSRRDRMSSSASTDTVRWPVIAPVDGAPDTPSRDSAA